MLRLFSKGDSSINDENKGQVIDSDRILDLIRFYPLGNKLTFYPEFQKELVLESIILAYVINDHVVYSERNIHSYQQDGKTVIVVTEDGKENVIKKVHNFYFLLPKDEGEGGKMDYVTKAELGARGCFKKGNNITLMSSSDDQGVPNLDSIVLKNTLLKSGIYKNHEVAVLDIQPDTFVFEEQRRHQRIQTNIQADISFSIDAEKYACRIQDFTERSLRIQFEVNSMLSSLIKEDRRIILNISLEQQQKEFVLRGNVLRVNDISAVILLTGIQKEKQFVGLTLIDTLEFKACLLKHPESGK